MRRVLLGAIAVIAVAALATPVLAQGLVIDPFDEPDAWRIDESEGGSWTIDGGFGVGTDHAWMTYADPERDSTTWTDLEVRFALHFDRESLLHVNQRNGDDRVYASLALDDTLRVAIRQGHGGGEMVTDDIDTGFDSEFYAVRFWSRGDVYSLDVIELDSDFPGGARALRGLWADEPLVEARVEGGPDAGEFAFEVVREGVDIDIITLIGDPIGLPPPVLPRAPTGWDLGLAELTAEVTDELTLRIDTLVHNFGPEDAPGASLVIDFDGVVLDERQVPAGLAPETNVDVRAVVSVPDELRGASGTVGVALRAPDGDLAPENDELRQPIDLPLIAPPPPANSGGISPWVPSAVVGVAAAAAGGELLRRRRWRRSEERRARQDRCEGSCRPGEGCTTHDLEPDPKLRRITGIVLSRQVDDKSEQKTVDALEVLDPLDNALWARRRRQADDVARHARDAATALLSVLRAWLDEGGPQARAATVAGTYEGTSGKATLKHFRCTDEGRWPDPEQARPKQTWEGTVTDKGTIVLGDVRPGADQVLVDRLSTMLVTLVDEVTHRRIPRSAEIGADVPICD